MEGERRGGRLEKGDCHYFLLTPAVKDLLYKIQTSFFFIKKDVEEERGIKKQNTRAQHNLHGYVHCTVYELCRSVQDVGGSAEPEFSSF